MQMKITVNDGTLSIELEGRIDASNAPEVEKEIMDAVEAYEALIPEIDAKKLEYISSTGLRVLLRLSKRAGGKITVKNVSSQVYDIFEVTGFTEFLNVEKALRFVSAKGLEKLGAGVHSTVYRLDDESIIKVVKDMSLEAIRDEMNVSKTAFIHGIPTAISYDVVETEEGYGEIYEMFRAGVLSSEMKRFPEKKEYYLKRFVDMYRQIHEIDMSDSILKPAKDRYIEAVEQISEVLEREETDKLRSFIEAIPDKNTFVHGDFHMSNVMLQDGELLLIDVGEAGYGHQLFDFAQTRWALCVATVWYPDRCERILGIPLDTASWIRDNIFREYYQENGESMERKQRVIDAMGIVRMLLIRYLQGIKEMPDFPRRIEFAREHFFPYADELCEIIKTDFKVR